MDSHRGDIRRMTARERYIRSYHGTYRNHVTVSRGTWNRASTALVIRVFLLHLSTSPIQKVVVRVYNAKKRKGLRLHISFREIIRPLGVYRHPFSQNTEMVKRIVSDAHHLGSRTEGERKKTSRDVFSRHQYLAKLVKCPMDKAVFQGYAPRLRLLMINTCL